MYLQVLKQDAAGREVWRWPARMLETRRACLRLEAFFRRRDVWLHGMHLARGARFVEIYYLSRWYNLHEIHAPQDDALLGWYCNVASPARYERGVLAYRDLALDLLVFPDGRQVVLDEDEFEALPLSPWEREQALRALRVLRRAFRLYLPHANEGGPGKTRLRR